MLSRSLQDQNHRVVTHLPYKCEEHESTHVRWSALFLILTKPWGAPSFALFAKRGFATKDNLTSACTTALHPSTIQVSGHGFTRAEKTQIRFFLAARRARAQRKRSDLKLFPSRSMALRSPAVPLCDVFFQALGVKGCLTVRTEDSMIFFHQLAATHRFLCYGCILPAGQHITSLSILSSILHSMPRRASGTTDRRPALPHR
jgi:hypothetical protein